MNAAFCPSTDLCSFWVFYFSPEPKKNASLTGFRCHFSVSLPPSRCSLVIGLVCSFCVRASQQSLPADLFKGHHSYLFPAEDAFVFLWCRVALYLFADECAAVSPQLAFSIRRYPPESFQEGQKQHMPAWLGGRHAILPVFLADRSCKL